MFGLQNSFLFNYKLDFMTVIVATENRKALRLLIRQRCVEKMHGVIFDFANSAAFSTATLEVSRMCKVKSESMRLYDTTVLK